MKLMKILVLLSATLVSEVYTYLFRLFPEKFVLKGAVFLGKPVTRPQLFGKRFHLSRNRDPVLKVDRQLW